MNKNEQVRRHESTAVPQAGGWELWESRTRELIGADATLQQVKKKKVTNNCDIKNWGSRGGVK